MKLKEVRESALALPLRSRKKLLADLQESLGDGQIHPRPPGVLSEDDPNFEAIIQARVLAYERGEVKAIPWEEVRERMQRRLHGNQSSSRRRSVTKK